jgi:two-component system response regulator MprA
VDVQPRTREGLRHALGLAGFDIALAYDGGDALRLVAADRPDAIILDTSRADGLALCRRLRETAASVPLLALGDSDSVDERIARLDAGADDYLAEPFVLDDLLARVRALVRRNAAISADVVRVADLMLDPETREVRRGQRRIELTPLEFRLLELLMRNGGRVLERTLIFTQVWGFDFGATSNALNVYVGYLRRKIEHNDERPLIHTVRGVGYMLREPAADS